MVEEIVRKIVTYRAIDGQIFQDEQQCRAYETGLPRHLQFCLRQKYTAEALNTYGVWEVGRTYTTAYTEYEPPGFLREGGDRTSWSTHASSDGLVEGTLSDAVAWACERDDWWNASHRYISSVKLIRL